MAVAYSQLNPKQKQAANHVHGPMLVLAGAGTGKTSVLVHRIARLVQQGNAQPSEIRAFTFTHKAAREIRERVSIAVPQASPSTLQASTFHGYCYHLLRESGEEFQLLDQFELWTFLRQRVSDLPLNRFLRAANPGRFLSDLLKFFDRCSDELVTAERYADYVRQTCAGELPAPRVAKKKQAEEMSADEVLERCREISAIFNVVERLLEENRLLTFGALVSRAAALLRREPELLARERAHARFLLVDEFQDSNHAQIELTRLLAGDAQNVFAVGDPDQAIYHFRGASSAAFNEFSSVFNRLEQKNIVNLAENQRSTQNILDCAFVAINSNPRLTQEGSRLRFDRERLVSARDLRRKNESTGFLFPPEPVEAVPYRDYSDECTDIAERILELRADGARWSDFAVLFRTHANANDLVEAFGARDIPFEVQDTDLFDTDALRDLMAWLHCATSLSQDVALFRLALSADSGIDLGALHDKMASAARGTKLFTLLETVAGGAELLTRVRQFAQELPPTDADLLRIIRAAAAEMGLSPEQLEFQRFRDFAIGWREKSISQTKHLPEFLEFLELYREAGGSLALAAPERPENEFLDADAGAAYTQSAATEAAHGSPAPARGFRERDEEVIEEVKNAGGGARIHVESGRRDAVKLLTVHAAKGLEFKHVFVLRVTSGSFPTSYRETLVEFPRELRFLNTQSDKPDEELHREEERRLFYVALTRARDTLTFYGKLKGGKSKQQTPAVFMRELAENTTLQHQFRLRDPHCSDLEVRAPEAPEWAEIASRKPIVRLELSASAIDAYARCPLKYSLQKLWRLPEEPSAALQYGAAMHSALRDFYDAAMRGVHRSADETVEIFKREFEAAKIEEELQRALYERQGAEQLREFIATRAAEPPIHVLNTEKPFRFMIEDVSIVGRIDRIDREPDGSVVVLDYKTGNPRSSMDARLSVQLGLYGLAATLEGLAVAKMVFYNLEDNSTAETESINESHLHETVLAAAEGIRAGRFDPSPAFHCKMCGYRSLCPATAEHIFPVTEQRAAAGVK